MQIESRRLERWRQTEDNTSQQRETKSKGKNGCVDLQGCDERQGINLAVRQRGGERTYTPVGEQQACYSARQRQQDRFREKLPNDTPVARTQRRPNRHLFLSGKRTSQQQAGYVGAGNQQDKGDRAKQDQQNGLNL